MHQNYDETMIYINDKCCINIHRYILYTVVNTEDRAYISFLVGLLLVEQLLDSVHCSMWQVGFVLLKYD